MEERKGLNTSTIKPNNTFEDDQRAQIVDDKDINMAMTIVLESVFMEAPVSPKLPIHTSLQATDAKEAAVDPNPHTYSPLQKTDHGSDSIKEAVVDPVLATQSLVIETDHWPDDSKKAAADQELEPRSHLPVMLESHEGMEAEKKGDDYQNEEKDADDADDNDDEESEEGEINTEMTPEEKKEMYQAVKSGDIDALEDCLDKPNADINMVWYKENLLMAAVRNGHKEMAEFLLDNGIDQAYSTSVVELRQTRRGKVLDRYDLTCRQMAYDQGMLDIVELIDVLQGNIFPFVRPTKRTPRHRRTKPPTSSDDSGSSSSDDESNDETDGENTSSSNISYSDNEGEQEADIDTEGKKRKKRKNEQRCDSLDENSNDLRKNEMNTGVERENVNVINTKHKRKSKEKSKDVDVIDDNNVDKRESVNKSDDILRKTDDGHGKLYPKNDRLSFHEMQENKVSDETLLASEEGFNPSLEKLELKFLQENNKQKTHADGESSYAGPKPPTTPKIRNRIWSSMSALASKKSNSYKSTTSSDESKGKIQTRPLAWKKVSSIGSYATESRHWHTRTPRPRHFHISENVSRSSSSASESSHQISISDFRIASSTTSTNALDNSKTKWPEMMNKADNSVTYHKRPFITTKTKLSPRFFNSYEVLNFVPEINSN